MQVCACLYLGLCSQPLHLNFTGQSAQPTSLQCRYSHGHCVPVSLLTEYEEPNMELDIGSRCLARTPEDLWVKGVVTAIEGAGVRVKLEGKNDDIVFDHDAVCPLSEYVYCCGELCNDVPVHPTSNGVPVHPTSNGVPVHPTPNGVPVHPTPNGVPVHPTPNGVPVHPTPNGVPVHPTPNGVPVHPTSNGVPVHPTPNGVPVHPTANGVPVHPTPNAVPVHPTPNGVPVHPTPNGVPVQLMVYLFN